MQYFWSFAPVPPPPPDATKDAHPPATLLKSSMMVAKKKFDGRTSAADFSRDRSRRLQQCNRWMGIFCCVWRGRGTGANDRKILHDREHLIKARTWSLRKRISNLSAAKSSLPLILMQNWLLFPGYMICRSFPMWTHRYQIPKCHNVLYMEASFHNFISTLSIFTEFL